MRRLAAFSFAISQTLGTELKPFGMLHSVDRWTVTGRATGRYRRGD